MKSTVRTQTWLDFEHELFFSSPRARTSSGWTHTHPVQRNQLRAGDVTGLADMSSGWCTERLRDIDQGRRDCVLAGRAGKKTFSRTFVELPKSFWPSGVTARSSQWSRSGWRSLDILKQETSGKVMRSDDCGSWMERRT